MEKSDREQLDEILEYAAKRGIVVPADILLEIGKRDARELIDALKITVDIRPEDLPIYTMTQPGAVPPPRKAGQVLASDGWIQLPPARTVMVGGGVVDHDSLKHLDYASAGHTGFQAALTFPLAANLGGTGISNLAASTLTLGAATSITGGGTLGLGGFTGSVPATGTFAMGAGTLTTITTNNVTGAAHTHAITPSVGLVAVGTAQFQFLTTGANPYNPAWSDFYISGTTGGKTTFAVTNTKTLTLTSTGDFNMTVPATLTVAGLEIANVYTAIQKINVNSTTALLVEQDGVKDNVLVVDTTNGRVGINGVPGKSLDIWDGGIAMLIGADNNLYTRTNNTQKQFLFGIPHYDNTEEPAALLFGTTLSSSTALFFGGGTALLNAATYIKFYTALNNTTTTGTERMVITSAGDVGIGSTNPQGKIHFIGRLTVLPVLIVQAAAIQTANIAEFQKSDATVYALINPVGGATFNENGEATGDLRAESDTEANMLFLDADADTDGALYFGGTTNGVKINKGGELTLLGTATVFNDANVGSLVLVTGGTLPGVVELLESDGGSSGIYSRGFAVGEQGSGVIEIPHDYKEGSSVTFHIHWVGQDAPSGTDNVRWQLTYSVTRAGVVTPAATTVVAAVDAAFDTQYNWMFTDVAVITGATYKIGDQFNFTITRIAASGDAYAGEAVVATLGLHYECDAMGSKTISAK